MVGTGALAWGGAGGQTLSSQEGVSPLQIVQPPESWEWLTVLVAVCSAGCTKTGDGSVCWAQEHVVLQNE